MNRFIKSLLITGALILSLAPFLPKTQVAAVDDLNEQIKNKQSQLTELKKQIDTYRNAIADKQAQSSSLKKQLTVLDDKVAQAELNIKGKELALATVTLQIQAVTLDVGRHEQSIADKSSKIAEILRQLYQNNQKSLLEIIALNTSFGKYFDQLSYLEELERNLQQQTNQLQTSKTELEHQQQNLALYKIDLTKTKNDLEESKGQLSSELNTKQYILKQTRESESRYQNLLTQAIQEQQKANADINNLEQEVRRRLKNQGIQSLNQLDTNFIWPVKPYKGLSTYFNDPTYIFRKYFEHGAIDIPNPQGTAIKAAAAGYVARAKDAGLGYSYIMIVHNNGLATVYGHTSRIDVEENSFVTKGQVIGAVGGLPGTRGAGSLTTGPHLHFEIRLNGIPVDPLNYLP
ncbi:peptidoglycan DD-metalloendopeptidase family protein [Patescibacteria group bacterium]|nr:peptidoglycan DD-metalloendopeptidase family protein [Patescibacteria group bacterium]